MLDAALARLLDALEARPRAAELAAADPASPDAAAAAWRAEADVPAARWEVGRVLRLMAECLRREDPRGWAELFPPPPRADRRAAETRREVAKLRREVAGLADEVRRLRAENWELTLWLDAIELELSEAGRGTTPGPGEAGAGAGRAGPPARRPAGRRGG